MYAPSRQPRVREKNKADGVARKGEATVWRPAPHLSQALKTTTGCTLAEATLPGPITGRKATIGTDTTQGSGATCVQKRALVQRGLNPQTPVRGGGSFGRSVHPPKVFLLLFFFAAAGPGGEVSARLPYAIGYGCQNRRNLRAWSAKKIAETRFFVSPSIFLS